MHCSLKLVVSDYFLRIFFAIVSFSLSFLAGDCLRSSFTWIIPLLLVGNIGSLSKINVEGTFEFARLSVPISLWSVRASCFKISVCFTTIGLFWEAF